MNTTIHEKLTSAGWRANDISAIAKNKLNEGIEAMFLYKDKLSLRFHPDQNFMRLLIHHMQETAGFEIAIDHNEEKVVDAIITLQDQFSTDDYFSQYLDIQKSCDISILAIEQFL